MKPFAKALKILQVDRAVAYTVIGRGWSFLAGPVTLLLIAKYLSGVEQGFYYTFNSVLGLQVFFELGLTYVIFQFASHERAKLEWTSEGTLEGDPEAKDRLFSLLRKSLLLYSLLAALVFAAMVPGGLFFFRRYEDPHVRVMWQIPWIWVVTATAADLLTSPAVAVLEGCGQVAEVALVRAGQFIVGSLCTWGALLLKERLYAAPMSNTVVFVGWWVWLLTKKKGFVKEMFAYIPLHFKFDWRKEVWPFQWKIALSGISSYFIFWLFTPILFMFKGATTAGQMGMSAAVMSAISMIAISWASTKMSPFGTLIAQRNFKKLDSLFFPSLWMSLGVLVLLGAGFWLADFGLTALNYPLALRLLSPAPLAILLGTTIINHIVGVEAMYLRAHKEEPFLVLSLVVATLTGACTYMLAKNFSVTAMLIANFGITLLFSFGWGTYIFLNKREVWHAEPLTFESV